MKNVYQVSIYKSISQQAYIMPCFWSAHNLGNDRTPETEGVRQG
jgi:hypothetical protein